MDDGIAAGHRVADGILRAEVTAKHRGTDVVELCRIRGVADHGHYRTVRPEIVLEVAFNHLQRSARHTSGYALRFPRIVRVRPDRAPADASTLADVARLAATLASAGHGPSSDRDDAT